MSSRRLITIECRVIPGGPTYNYLPRRDNWGNWYGPKEQRKFPLAEAKRRLTAPDPGLN